MANASYAARQPPAVEGEDPVNVLVTGFGPFLDKYPINSSWSIASTLPALLPSTPSTPTPIQIRIHPYPIRVAYANVHSTIPTILPPGSPISPPPDIVLHIGLAASRTFYAIEQGAHQCGYGVTKDVDGEIFGDERGEQVFAGRPGVLGTGFCTDDVLGRWTSHLASTPSASPASANSLSKGVNSGGMAKPDVRINPDAGNFLCGFIYYNSLAHYYHINGQDGDRPVVFLHVPDLSGSEERMKEGREVAVALIRALVESRSAQGVRNFGGAVAVQEDDRRNNTTA